MENSILDDGGMEMGLRAESSRLHRLPCLGRQYTYKGVCFRAQLQLVAIDMTVIQVLFVFRDTRYQTEADCGSI